MIRPAHPVINMVVWRRNRWASLSGLCSSSSHPCFHSVKALNVSCRELSLAPFLLFLLCLLPPNSASVLNVLSLAAHTHTHNTASFILCSIIKTHTCPNTHTPSCSLRCVLPESGLLCTVQSSVHESLTTQTYSSAPCSHECLLCVCPDMKEGRM